MTNLHACSWIQRKAPIHTGRVLEITFMDKFPLLATKRPLIPAIIYNKIMVTRNLLLFTEYRQAAPEFLIPKFPTSSELHLSFARNFMAFPKMKVVLFHFKI